MGRTRRPSLLTITIILAVSHSKDHHIGHGLYFDIAGCFERGFPMSFSEVCIYQVKPDKVDEFESIMNEAKPFLEERTGLLQLRLMKRGYKIDMEQIREGLPPVELTRVVKCVKYVLFWEFESKEDYGRAQKDLYETFWKSIDRCLIQPHDKFLGEVMI